MIILTRVIKANTEKAKDVKARIRVKSRYGSLKAIAAIKFIENIRKDKKGSNKSQLP